MKHLNTLMVLILTIVFAFAAASCKSTPPQPEPPHQVSPPPPLPSPPPPPPPAEQEAEPEAEIDTSLPEITVSMSPQPFSPDGDGVDDLLTVHITVTSPTEIGGWHIEIREPEPPYGVFSEWSDLGMPPEELEWDGLSADGELVQSASNYYFAISVSNAYGAATYQGTFEIDVLVNREGDVLRAIVPSIVFPPNSGNFTGLDGETESDNDYILKRIAEVLNRYSTYRVTVEGHANPTTLPGTRQRAAEEAGTRTVKGLKALSEERAHAIVNYLVDLGVERSRLSAIGAGGTRTVADFEDRDHWWKNRRVEFILEK